MNKLTQIVLNFYRVRKRVQHGEEGSSLIYVALSLMVLLGFAGLAVDGSYAYSQHNRMQVAADASALAGARLVALERTHAEIGSQIDSVARRNGADWVEWEYINDKTGVHVDVSRTYETWFAHLFGWEDLTTGADAEAEAFGVAGLSNLLPLTTMCTDSGFEVGMVYTLWVNDMDAPGSFGWVDWNGGSSSNGELANNINDVRNSGEWNIGDQVPAGPGVENSSAVRSALSGWMGKSATVPLYSQVHGSGNNATYEICGFAEFIITGYKFKGGDKWLQGIFTRNIKYGEVPSAGDGVDYGVRDVRLLE